MPVTVTAVCYMRDTPRNICILSVMCMQFDYIVWFSIRFHSFWHLARQLSLTLDVVVHCSIVICSFYFTFLIPTLWGTLIMYGFFKSTLSFSSLYLVLFLCHLIIVSKYWLIITSLASTALNHVSWITELHVVRARYWQLSLPF